MEQLLPKNNVLLVKDSIGKAKPCTFKLPAKAHTYGKPEDRTQEGAGAITSSWLTHNASQLPSKVIPNDFKKLNKVQARTGAKQNEIRVSYHCFLTSQHRV